MAFSLKFYNVSDPPNKLDKTIGTQIASCATVRPFEAVSELTGNFLIDYNAKINGCNYCYCQEVDKYYYITDIQMETAQRMIISVKVDVLKTYASGIKSSPIYVTRAEQQATEDNPCGYNTYIHDAQIRKTAREFTIVKIDPNIPKFEYPDSEYPDTRQYILGVIG